MSASQAHNDGVILKRCYWSLSRALCYSPINSMKFKHPRLRLSNEYHLGVQRRFGSLTKIRR